MRISLKSYAQRACVAFTFAATLASCATLTDGTPTGIELTGTVIDASTGKPIEGAYVLAGYGMERSGLGGWTVWCVKTRGMYTGSDGRYRFPVEKLDGLSPSDARAIKPGYFRGKVAEPSPDDWKKQNAAAYAGRDIWLNPQDPAKPEFIFGNGDENCHHAPTRSDAKAGVEFLKIEIAEITRLGASAEGIDATRRIIQSLESLPNSIR